MSMCNLSKRVKTGLVLLLIIFSISISFSLPAFPQPECTCPKGDEEELIACWDNTNNTPPADPVNTIWVEKDGADYLIHGGPQDGENYVPGITTLQGTEDHDLIIGTNEGDIIEGGRGDDTICGGNGKDEIHGGPGNDYICGGNQDDTLYGDDGNDVIEGNNGKDTIDGGPNNDCLYGNNANDEIGGGGGDNYIDGGNGNDDCYDADDIVNCEEGNAPYIECQKKTEGGTSPSEQDADDPPGPLIETGQSVDWVYEIKNIGSVGVSDIDVVDDMGGDSEKEICSIDSLTSDDSATCRYSDEYEQATAEIGQYSNEAKATFDHDSTTYIITDPSHYFGTELSIDEDEKELQAEITQEGHLDIWNSGTVSNIQFKPTTGSNDHSFKLTFAYPKGYEVEVDYNVDLGDASPSTLHKDPLILDSENHGGIISGKYIPREGDGTLDLRSEGDFDTESESDSLYEQEYDLFVDPKKLIEDYAAEDILTFTVNFTVSEDSI